MRIHLPSPNEPKIKINSCRKNPRNLILLFSLQFLGVRERIFTAAVFFFIFLFFKQRAAANEGPGIFFKKKKKNRVGVNLEAIQGKQKD